jgi:hypothetical protein
MWNQQEQERFARCQTYAQIVIDSVDWSTISDDPQTLATAMSHWCQIPIAIRPMALPVPENGCLIKQAEQYLIGYAEHLPRLLQQQTILHELAHIVRDRLVSSSSPGDLAVTLATLPSHFVQSALRFRHPQANQTEEELETELLADLLSQYLEIRVLTAIHPSTHGQELTFIDQLLRE